MIKEKAYAKINLTLNILNKREDNYHNLKSVLLPIDFYDELSFEISDEYKLISNVTFSDNIIDKIFNIFKNRYNIKNVKITLNKNIYDKAGLGGGSSDATAAIRGLNRLFNLNLSIQEQEEIANSVGSDTLFTLHSKPAIISSRGDEIEFFDLDKEYYVLLIKPSFGMSTKSAFANIKEFNQNHNDEIISYLQNNDITNIKRNCYNSFLESLLQDNNFKNFYEDINNIEECYLSGSGSTLFIIDNNLEDLKEIQSKLKYESLIVKTLTS